jgi:hypothetical protein
MWARPFPMRARAGAADVGLLPEMGSASPPLILTILTRQLHLQKKRRCLTEVSEKEKFLRIFCDPE